ncbi:hypothetical protein, partial [Luteolibacter marinus]|uniref:hypothetical protein n=1 Tax=Luteolibacter marinus TaxID=2776705 RepID=UPI0018680EE5
MKRTQLLAILPVLIPTALSAQLLFEDTFERPNADDINASSAGSAGITNNTGTDLSAGAWTENYNAGGVSTRTNIGKTNHPGTLFLADGAGTSNVYLNHNFTNAAIPAEGGFSVTLGIHDFGTIDDPGQIAALAVGMTEAEAQLSGDANTGNNKGDGNSKFQDAVADGGNTTADIAISDFWVALRGLDGTD